MGLGLPKRDAADVMLPSLDALAGALAMNDQTGCASWRGIVWYCWRIEDYRVTYFAPAPIFE